MITGMQQEDQPGSVRNELLERLRAMEGPQSSNTLAELAYRRAREALEHALEEARSIRLRAIEDARDTRERELTALMESMRTLRQSAESQIDTLLRTAELEASRMHDQARSDAQAVQESANREAEAARAEGAAIRTSAEERAREIDRLEAEFNAAIGKIVQQIGLETPSGGWWRHLLGRK